MEGNETWCLRSVEVEEFVTYPEDLRIHRRGTQYRIFHGESLLDPVIISS